MEIVLIRHGLSEANKKDCKTSAFLCGRSDCSLSEQGIEEATALKKYPLLKDADAVFCSPLKRAIQTAELFTNQPLIIDERLQERTMGDFDGQYVDQLKENPQYLKYFTDPKYMDYRNSFVTRAPNGENLDDVEKRVSSFLDDQATKDYKKVIIVSHAMAIKCMLKVINGLSQEDVLHMRIKHCNPIIANFHSNEEFMIELQDDQWPYQYTDHDRTIARAIVYDDNNQFYFVRVDRDDDFGKDLLIETSGGGVDEGEDLHTAIKRELKEEIGAEVEIVCKIGVVSDYYNLIHRHNINNYFLCKVKSFGDKHLTKEEINDWKLSTLILSYDDAVNEYQLRASTPLGKLIASRELPILHRAHELLEEKQKSEE